MAITLNEIPSKTLTPFMAIEIGERDLYSSVSTTVRALFIGTAPKGTGTLEKMLNSNAVKDKFGEDSPIFRMADAFFKNSTGHECHCIGLASGDTVDKGFDLIGDEIFQIVASPNNTTDELGKAVTEFENRFKALEGLGGNYLTGVTDTVGNLTTNYKTYDSKNLCLVEIGSNNDASTTIGAIVGQMVQSASADPAIPFNFLKLEGITPRPAGQRRTREERQSLLEVGIGTLAEGNDVRIESIVTTYKTNENGVEDDRWKFFNSVLLASYVREDLKNHFTSKYGRAKLGIDGKNYAPGQKIMTPSVGRAELLGKFKEYESRGFVEDVDGLAKKIVVEKDGNILKFSAEVDLMNQLKAVYGTIKI